MSLFLCTLLVICFLSNINALSYTYKSGTSPTCTGNAGDLCGPEHWGNIPAYATCGTGKRQTPINLSNANPDITLQNPSIEVVDGGCDSWEQGANDHAFEVNFVKEDCWNMGIAYNGKRYRFQQYHFHSPSEHTIAGAHYSAEAHMVHKSEDGSLLVLGVLLQEQYHAFYNNSFLDMVWKKGGDSMADIAMEKVVEVEHPFNPYREFLPPRLSHYAYHGSLTTPPCTEGVQWIVFDEPVLVSSDDIKILRGSLAAYDGMSAISELGHDNRPVQPGNGRNVRYASGLFDGVPPPRAPPKSLRH